MAVDSHRWSSHVCVAVSWVVVFFGVPLAFTPCIILSNPSFATRYPSSRPKSIPLSIPSFRPNFFPSIIPNFSPSSNARIQSNLRFSPSLVVAAQLQNWAIVLRSANSRKQRKLWQADDVDSDAVLAVSFAGDATAASGAVVRFFEDFF